MRLPLEFYNRDKGRKALNLTEKYSHEIKKAHLLPRPQERRAENTQDLLQ